jgi:hypothetical protein
MRESLAVCAVKAPEMQKVGTGPLGFLLEAGTLKYIKKMLLSPEGSAARRHLDWRGHEIVPARIDHPRTDELAATVTSRVAVG